MITVRFVPSGFCRNSVACAWPRSRAATIGHAVSHGRWPSLSRARLQHVAAEPARRASPGVDAQHPLACGLRYRTLRSASTAIHALDDAAQHRLRLGLAPSQRGRQLDEVAAHVLHRAGERGRFPDRARRPGWTPRNRPRPSRVADRPAPAAGRTMRRASSSAASTASTPSTNAVHASRRDEPAAPHRRLPDAGSRASSSATPSPVDAMIGVLDA